MFDGLVSLDPDASQAALIEHIAALERLKSAAAAAQAKATNPRPHHYPAQLKATSARSNTNSPKHSDPSPDA